MKTIFGKIILLLFACILSSTSANADVIIQGRAVSSSQQDDGSVLVNCKRKNAECVHIVTATIAYVYFLDGTQQVYSIDGYAIVYENETDTEVLLYGVK